MRLLYSLLALAVVLTFSDCSSGKKAYKNGDYYEAVLTSVQRLRGNPDHKKSTEVLKLSYQAAVDYLETHAQNQIASNANFKYKSAVANYERINNLYEQIRTSPGALKIIPNPVNRFKELTDLKAKAAEESYEAGVQSLMLTTRQDSKNAYYYFNDANTFSPGYREAIEMMEQAKTNATIFVVVEPSLNNRYSWNFEPVMFGYQSNIFVRFFTPREAEEKKIPRVDQFLKVAVNSYDESRPSISRRTETRVDSVKTGEKTVNGQKIPIFQKITSTTTILEKKVTSHGSISMWVTDGSGKADLQNREITSDMSWTDSWATYTGDIRALSAGNKKLVEKREPSMSQNYLINATKKDLDDKLRDAIVQHFSQY